MEIKTSSVIFMTRILCCRFVSDVLTWALDSDNCNCIKALHQNWRAFKLFEEPP